MKRAISIFFLLTIAITGYSQTWKRNRVEVFAGIPINHYFGDIGGSASSSNMLGLKDISYRAVRSGISFGAIFRLSQTLYVQGTTNIGYFGNTDKGSRNEARNYGFSTYGTELTASAMYFLIPESDQNYFYSVMDLRGGLRKIRKPYSLYIFAGMGGLFYKVTPKLDLIDSDRFDNSEKFATVIPLGVGVKYQLFARTLLGAELGARYLLSDYMDGFSPSQSKHNDVYYTLSFKLYYRISYEKFIKKSVKWF